MPHTPPSACQRCGVTKRGHRRDPDACVEFVPPGEPWIGFPPTLKQAPPGSKRAAWNLFDPNALGVWLIVPKPEWTFAFRLVLRDGAFPIAELRVFPSEPPDQTALTTAGEWTFEPDSVPHSGITSAVLRTAPLSAVRDNTQRLLAELRNSMGEAAFQNLLGSRDLPPDILSRIQRAAPATATTHEQQTRAAALYSVANDSGEKTPVAKVAEQMYLSRGRVRDLLHEARRNGYLTPARHGIAEGRITRKGIDFLYSLSAEGRRP
jgi:hypothetical protein